MSQLNLEQQIEALLFVAPEPVSLRQLAMATGAPETKLVAALAQLQQQLQARGIRLMSWTERYSLVSAPSAGPLIEKFLAGSARTELTKPALETLAIIAYKQPITKAKIETIRGVASDQTVKSLLARGLIAEDQTPDPATNARRYQVSAKFLQHFGLAHTNELPKLDSVQEQVN